MYTSSVRPDFGSVTRAASSGRSLAPLSSTKFRSYPTGSPPAAFRSLPIAFGVVKSNGVPATGVIFPVGMSVSSAGV